MNIFEKLQNCRITLQNMSLKKSGANKFAGYDYYELADFLPQINQLFNDNKLFSMISFTADIARLTIINTEKPDEAIEFTSPMSDAQLKGCHAIQNLGAVETYQRRYLYMTALEIVEHDALDPVTGKENGCNGNNNAKPKQPPKTDTAPSGKATKEQIKEVFARAKEKTPDVFAFIDRLAEDGKISTKYPYGDKEKTKINWTAADISAIMEDLDLPF